MLIGYSKLPYYIYSEHFKWFIIALYVILLSTKKGCCAKHSSKNQVGK